jgi:hypothetical protein
LIERLQKRFRGVELKGFDKGSIKTNAFIVEETDVCGGYAIGHTHSFSNSSIMSLNPNHIFILKTG